MGPRAWASGAEAGCFPGATTRGSPNIRRRSLVLYDCVELDWGFRPKMLHTVLTGVICLGNQQRYWLALPRGLLRLCYLWVPSFNVTLAMPNVLDFFGFFFVQYYSSFGEAESVFFPNLHCNAALIRC